MKPPSPVGIFTGRRSPHKPIAYPIALLQKSSRQDAGQAFIQFVQSPEGQAILSKYGFTRP